MTLSKSEDDTLRQLEAALRRAQKSLQRLDSYYELTVRVAQLGLAVPPELRDFETIAAWPRITADAVEERIDLEGFRLPGSDEADEDLWRVWQANDLDEESQLAHLDALVFGRSFVCVGSGDAGPESDLESGREPGVPLVTVESPLEMTVTLDPRTRLVKAALKMYEDTPVVGVSEKLATLYLPDVTIWLRRDGAVGRWVEEDRDEHDLGAVPVVPLVNRARTKARGGVSELTDVIPLTDAAARALTNVQLATEALAVPQRYVLGATQGDFIDEDGNQLTAWESYFGAVWTLYNSEAKVGQFTAADLQNFANIVSHYATLAAGVTGLPVRFFGQNLANPPSAEGIRADEARLIKRAERRQRAWGGSWERVMRLVRRITDGSWDADLASMETLWRDPATPTKAQQADATVKLVQAGVLPVEASWEDLGYSATRRAKLKILRDRELEDPTIAGLLRDVSSLPTTAEPPAPAVTGAAGG